jgi:hypothetical protein
MLNYPNILKTTLDQESFEFYRYLFFFFSLAAIASLQRNYAEALSRTDVKAIVLTGIFLRKEKKEFLSSISCWCCASSVPHAVQVPMGGFAVDSI